MPSGFLILRGYFLENLAVRTRMATGEFFCASAA
jgi:hypothetical protein